MSVLAAAQRESFDRLEYTDLTPYVGKRGGVRVIYFWRPSDQAFYLLFAYATAGQEDLTREQLRVLARVVREELK